MNADVKFCKDCRHCTPREYFSDWRCNGLSEKTLIYLLSGEATPGLCLDARSNLGPCGPEAKFFEPKEEGETK